MTLRCEELLTPHRELNQLVADPPVGAGWRDKMVPVLADDLRAWLTGHHPEVDWCRMLVVREDTTGQIHAHATMHASHTVDAKLSGSGLLSGGPALYFGALLYRNRAALRALLAGIHARAEQQGFRQIFGPVSLLPNQTGGAVLSGFEHPGFFDSTYNDPVLVDVAEEFGYTTVYPAATWELPVATIPDQYRTPPTVEEYRRAGVRPRKVTRWNLRGRSGVVEHLRAGHNAAFAQLPYYTQISPAQMRAQAAGLEVLVDPRLVVILDHDLSPSASTGPASFALVVPDPVSILRSHNGRLGPRQLAELAGEKLRPVPHRTSSLRDAVLITQGTDPQLQGRGLLSLVSRQLFAQLCAAGYRTLRVTYIGEDNPASAEVFRRAGGYRLHGIGFLTTSVQAVAQPDSTGWADRVRGWIQIAGRAPSAHNTQPWNPLVDAPKKIINLGVHPERRLIYGDPTDRDLYLALGCWIESLKIAASQDSENPHRLSIESVTGSGANTSIRLRLQPLAAPTDDFSAEDVLSRRVYRGVLTPASDVVATALAEFPQAVEFTDPRISDLETIASRHLSSSPELIRELTGWLRLDPHHPRRHLDGLDGGCLLLPPAVQRLARVARTPLADVLATPLSATSRMLARVHTRFGSPGTSTAEHYTQTRGTPVLFSAPAESPAQIIDAGRTLHRLWLRLHQLGLSVAPATEMIDAPATASYLHRWVTSHDQQSQHNYRPLSYFRVGVPASTPPRSARMTGR